MPAPTMNTMIGAITDTTFNQPVISASMNSAAPATAMALASRSAACGLIRHASRFADALSGGKVLAPAKSLVEMQRIVFNDRVDAMLAALFASIVVVMVVYGVLACIKAMHNPRSTALEIGGAIAGAGDD